MGSKKFLDEFISKSSKRRSRCELHSLQRQTDARGSVYASQL